MDPIHGSINNDGNSIEMDIYYKTLCSSGLSFVAKQSQQIEQRRQTLIDNKQKIVYTNYDSFLKYSDFTKKIIDDFQTIETCLDQLDTSIPEFKDQCQTFSTNTKQISNRWNNVSLMLSKYPQLIEFMEIPQLLNNCIRTFYYDDAILICDFVTKLCSKHSKDASIFQNMLCEVDKCKDNMVAQILRELSGNILLPNCMKMIKYLRQIDRFTEDQLRINFLTCRDVWFQYELNREIGNQNYCKFFQMSTLNQINRATESFRVNIFDIVTQYQAIFPEMDQPDDSQSKNHLQSKIINSWLLVKIEQYLNILLTNLSSCISINSILYIDTVIENCFYLGLSMNKIGADIRPKLILIFNDFFEKRFKHCVQESTRKLCDSFGDIFVAVNNESIEHYPILKKYQSNLLAIFHEIHNNVPLALITTFVQTLNTSFETIMMELKSYI
ncbi:conserved oligomeric Golgi complex subunit 8-like protein, partial [Euroglyphus maynei]